MFRKIYFLYCMLFCLVLAGCSKYENTSQRQNTDPSLIMPTSEEGRDAMGTTESQEIPTELPDSSAIPLMMPISEITEGKAQTTTVTAQAKQESIPTQTQAITINSAKIQQKSDSQKEPEAMQQTPPQVAAIRSQEGTISDKELDFDVENQTGKTVYVACFSYIKKRPFSRWRWDKSPVYKIEDNKSVTIDLDTIPDNEDRDNTFGYLAVFENETAANDSIFELLTDSCKIDLDVVSQLKGKRVVIEIEKYGIAGDFYDYNFVNKKKAQKKLPELDFFVENKTGKPILVTCFVYEKKAKGTWLAQKTRESWTIDEDARDDMSVWRFDKTSVIKIMPNQSGEIDIDTIIEQRDREYVRGYLAIFDTDEKEQAEKSVYELLKRGSKRTLDLGRLINIKNKKISVYTERYGVMGNFIDYNVKPAEKPNIQKVINGHFK